MLPAYLAAYAIVISPGLLFTLVVDKTIPSLFGPGDAETTRRMTDALEETGYGAVAPRVGEKLFRILHCIAFLLASLGHPGPQVSPHFHVMPNASEKV